MFQNLTGNTSKRQRRSLVQALLGDDVSCCSSNSGLNSKENIIEWTWDVATGNDFVDLLNNDRDVTFHRKHSSGTAVVRGTEPMSHGQHFWEIEMISPVYGTDMMVGVGTSEADMSQLQDTFISRLGKDNLTWGFSYTGSFYHNGEARVISSAFDQGSIIGMHLDLWNGTLSFYKNKKHLGVASKGLKGKTLYAMASSTAACSGMRILRSCSFPSSLQFLCCSRLRDLIPDDKCVLSELTIPPGLKLFLKNNLSWLLNPRLIEEHPYKNQYLTKPRRHLWPFDIPVDNYHSPESTSSDSLGYSTYSPQPGVNFIIVGRRGVPYSFQNYNRFQQQREMEELQERFGPVDFSDVVMGENLGEEQGESTESETKRRRHSYNYAMGLSDPDSDTEL